jgi:hypothetical protein
MAFPGASHQAGDLHVDRKSAIGHAFNTIISPVIHPQREAIVHRNSRSIQTKAALRNRVLIFSEMLQKYSKSLCVVNRIIKSECRAQNSFPNGSYCPPKIRVYHEIRVDCQPPTPRRDK